MSQQLTPWYGNVRRTVYGTMWAFWTLLFTIGGIVTLVNGSFGGLLLIALGVLAGRYDYRIWAGKAKRLWFFILF